jgi:sigma-B regulation protein RsbU (phosphoserine phosphatase)
VKLLIAEDDLFFQKMLQRVLTPDHELEIVHDGNEAWAMLQRPDAPRLAILDWVMPGLTGPQVCRKVRACAALSPMYLIILTARNSEADIVSGLRAGADDYITKPPIPAELRARVRVGERILELQAAVEEQAVLANQASGRENHLRASLAGCPVLHGLPGQEHLSGIEACPRQHFEPGDYCSVSRGESCTVMLRPLSLLLENRNSHR